MSNGERPTSNFESSSRRHDARFREDERSLLNRRKSGDWFAGQMIDPPYRTVAVASTFSPRFMQVLAEGKRIRDRLASQLHLIYFGKRDEETIWKFSSALRQLDLPVDSTIYYH